MVFIWTIMCSLAFLLSLHCDETINSEALKCANYEGKPTFCYPPFENHASAGLKVTATNTCGMTIRQKYCIGLSSMEMKDRCAYCDDRSHLEQHSSDYLTDHYVDNWWQSESLAHNKIIHFHQSVNLTVNLGNQFHVTFIHLQFKSPRPAAMVIYRKYNNDRPWTPWLYLSTNCRTYFNMTNYDMINKLDEVLCTELFSTPNIFYGGVITFSTLKGRPGASDFFNNKDAMDWTTASQIRIELKKMLTFGDEYDEDESLLTHFFAIQTLQVAGRCWCNGHGNECHRSTGESVEHKLFCACHPTHHTTGQGCEKCDTFFQDRPWESATTVNANECKRCNCNGNADSCIFDEELYRKSGNTSGGLCLNCLGNTKGPHCEECIEGFFKDPNHSKRCIPCNCNPVGKVSAKCDNIGKCLCQPGVEGDKCTRCKGDHYNFGLYGCQPCNCHPSGVNGTSRLQCNPSTGMCYCKKNAIGEKCDSCVQGYFSLSDEDPLGCRPCFCFAHTKECTTASGFLLTQIVSEFESNENEWKYGIGAEPAFFTPMLDASTKPHAITWFRNREPWADNYFLWAPAKFLGDHQLSYNLHLELTLSFSLKPDQSGLDSKFVSMINDVELISDTMSVNVPFFSEAKPFPEAGSDPQVFRFRLHEESGLWRDKMDHFRFISILSNLLGIRIRLTNPFGFIKLHKAVLFTATDKKSLNSLGVDLPMAINVEKCTCPPQYTGLSCENCSVGHHRSSAVGTEFVKCIKCMCNNQSEVCDVKTGKCECGYNTMGHNCEKCDIGYYGDPTTLIRNVCQPCGCPGGTSCELVKMADGDRVACTNCPDNLGGYRCDRCRDNFFGDPRLNIQCKPCNCHGNIDYFSSCDTISGKCSKCLYNSAGDHCESCKSGYHLSGNEYAPNRCKKCFCNPLGSVEGGLDCDVNTGQCQCHTFVAGRNCDICKPGFFNLTPLLACEACKCFVPGSVNNTCDLVSGQCFCKPGVVGTLCDRCEPGYFNLSQTGCQRCQCDFSGSRSQDCHSLTGECSCKPNVVGVKCDMCIENHHNITGGCPSCSPCYTLLQGRVNSIRSEISITVRNMNSLNGSFNQRNISNLILLAQDLNKTVNEIFESIIKNFAGMTSIQGRIEKSTKILHSASIDLIELKINDKDEELTTHIRDIKQLKEKIEILINVDFRKNLEKLKQYISAKSTAGSNITKMAETARSLLQSATLFNEKILAQVSKTESDLNSSLAYFTELVTSYYMFINESDELNLPILEKLSESVSSDGLSNLNDIRDIDKRHSDVELKRSETDKKLKDVGTKSDKLFRELSVITEKAREFEEKIHGFLRGLPDLKTLEQEISTKASSTKYTTKSMTDLMELRERLNRAQKNITDANAKAQTILRQLRGISQDFDEVVNASKLEATENLNKLPQLKLDLEKMDLEIQILRSSSSNFISNLKTAFFNSSEIFIQSKDLDSKFKNLESKTLMLKKDTLVNLNISLNIQSTLDDQLKNDSLIRRELQNLIATLKNAKSVNTDQRKSVNDTEDLLLLLERQLKDLENQSTTSGSDQMELYWKMVNAISIDIINHEKSEMGVLLKEVDLMDAEWDALTKEIEEAGEEIRRLELINSYMIGSAACHRSGGTVER